MGQSGDVRDITQKLWIISPKLIIKSTIMSCLKKNNDRVFVSKQRDNLKVSTGTLTAGQEIGEIIEMAFRTTTRYTG